MPNELVIVQNAEFEGPGLLREWAEARGYRVQIVHAQKEILPDVEEFSHLALLGSPHSVTEIHSLPWIRAEAELAASALRHGRKVLGICFGAQLLAQLLGGAVTKGENPEIGWHDFELEGKKHPLFQWHGEVFSLPRGARALGRSEATPVPAFTWERQLLAIGGHPEMDPALVESFIASSWSDEWVSRQSNRAFIHRPDRIRAETPNLMPAARAFAYSMFDRWAAL